MFKKITALLLVFCILFCFSACDVDTSVSRIKDSIPETSSSQTETSSGVDADGDMFYDDEDISTTSETVTSREVSTSSEEVSSREFTYTNDAVQSDYLPETSSSKISDAVVSTQTEPEEELVWIPTNGGTKHHRNPRCSNMKNPEQVTKKEALRWGYAPCKKCYK